MWRRWLVVIVATATILAAAFWAELQYQPRISGGHQQQHRPSYAIGNSSQKSIFPAEFFVWIDDVVGWTDTHHDFVLAVANVFLAAFTLALFAATFGLLRFAKRQAGDMESLLTAAHDTAVASASQVRAIEAQERVMSEQARTMAANLDLTRQAANAAQASADAANAHAIAAEEANKINRQALSAIDRPWIAVRMEIPEGEPVTFGAEAIEAKIQIRVENVGKSPATRINCAAEMYPDMVIAQRRVRDIGPIDIPYQQIVGFGKLLVPGDYFIEDFDLSVSTAEFKQQIMDVLAEGRPAVIAIVWYNVPAASDPKTTIVTGEIAPSERGKYGFDGTLGDFSAVKIVQSFVNRAT